MNTLQFSLLLWPVLALVVAKTSRISRRASVGLPLAYLGGLFLIHWPGAALYLQAGYSYYRPDIVKEGFFLTTLGAAAFVIGLLVISLFGKRTVKIKSRYRTGKDVELESGRLAKFLLYFGLFTYLVLQPLLAGLPTITAVVSGMAELSVVGICLGVWGAFQTGNARQFRFWLLIALLFPFVTLLNAAFVGYGVHNLLTVMAFILVLVKLRVRTMILLPMLVYLGLSFYVSYMRDRGEYRELAWRQQAGVVEKLAKVGNMFFDFEFFDPDNELHLNNIDRRLNQNWLVGSSVEYMEAGNREFANGETLFNAVIALIPRILWPDKPKVGGGGDLVTNYTGIYFAKYTSVGAGQILEFYANFGRYGVVLGMFILGLAMGVFDNRAAYYLRLNNYKGFILWFLPGLGFLQAGGNFVEIAATVGASLGTAIIVIFMAKKYMGKKVTRRLVLPG